MKILSSALLLWMCCLANMSATTAADSSGQVISLAVISHNRLEPLRRLCESLIRVQNPKKRNIKIIFNLKASSSDELMDYVYEFSWPFGEKIVRTRVVQGGLIPAVLESWYPAHSADYGVLLEDDIEVSPLWLLWIDKMLKGIKTGAFHQMNGRIIGSSLSSEPQNSFKNLGERPEKSVDIRESIAHVSIEGSPSNCGMLFLPLAYRRFLSYAKGKLAKEGVAVSSNMSQQQQIRTDSTSINTWIQLLSEYMESEGSVLIYPSFPEKKSFCIVQTVTVAAGHKNKLLFDENSESVILNDL